MFAMAKLLAGSCMCGGLGPTLGPLPRDVGRLVEGQLQRRPLAACLEAHGLQVAEHELGGAGTSGLRGVKEG